MLYHADFISSVVLIFLKNILVTTANRFAFVTFGLIEIS